MRLKFTVLPVLLLVCLSFSSKAQLGEYTFSQTLGTSYDTLVAPLIPLDTDAVYPAYIQRAYHVPLPFTFTLGNISSDSVWIDLAGFVALKKVGVAPTSSSSFSDGALSKMPHYQGVIAPYSTSFNVTTGPGSNFYGIRMATSGTTPNRVCSIEWRNRVDNNKHVKIRLYEANGDVEFCYPAHIGYVFSFGGFGLEVGMRLADTSMLSGQTVARTNHRIDPNTNVWNIRRWDSSRAAEWLHEKMGTSSQSRMQNSAFITYKWSRPGSCVSSTAALVLPDSISLCAGKRVLLTPTGLSSGLNYQWQTSMDGTSWTNIVEPDSTALRFQYRAKELRDSVRYYRVQATCASTSSTVYSNKTKLKGSYVYPPYFENFESTTFAAPFPSCMTTPWSTSTNMWNTEGNNGRQYSGLRSMRNGTGLKTWLYTPGIYLEAGKQYRFSHMLLMATYYNSSPDTFQMAIGTRPHPDSIANVASEGLNPAPIYRGPSMTNREQYIWKNLNFSVPSSGVYFAGLARSSNNSNGGSIDDLQIMEVPATDIQVDSILSPAWYSTSCFLPQLPVTITVKNAGTTAVSNIPVYYKIGTTVYGPETISASIPAGGRITHTFTQQASLPALSTTYRLQAFAAKTGDTYKVNDTSMADYLWTDTLKPVPYLQTFEVGGISTNSVRYFKWWAVDSVSSLGSANGSTEVLRINFGKIPAGKDSIASVPIGPISAASFMRFKYRMSTFVGNPGTMSTLDTIYVTARANCGAPSDTLMKIHAGFQTSTASLQHIAPVSLAKYAGSNIRISFVTRRASPFTNLYFDIDSFQVVNLPLTDIGLLSVDTIQSVVCLGDSTKVSISLANNGGLSASGFPIKISIDGQAPVISYTYPRTLTYTNRDSVRLGNVGFSTTGMHELKIFVQHTGDGNATNDTLVRKVFAIAPSSPPAAIDTALCAASFDFNYPKTDSTTIYWYTNNAPFTPPFRTSNSLQLTKTDSFFTGSRRHVPVSAVPAASHVNWSSVANYMNSGIAFDALSDFILDSVGMYPSGTGSLTFDVVSCASCTTPTVLKTYTFSFSAANAANKVMLPVELAIKQGKDYAIRLNSISGLNGVVRDFPFTGFPLQNNFAPVTLRNSYTAFGSSYDFYYYFYDWKIKALATCVSPARIKAKASLYSQPKPRFQYNQNGAVVDFGNNSSGGGTYLWRFGNGDTTNMEAPTYTYLAPGTYTATLIQTNLCGTDSISRQIEIEGSSSVANSQAWKGVHIYPNPVSSSLNISFNALKTVTVSIQILDATGRTLQSTSYSTAPGANSLQQDLSSLANGNYWIRISDGQQEARFTIAVLR